MRSFALLPLVTIQLILAPPAFADGDGAGAGAIDFVNSGTGVVQPIQIQNQSQTTVLGAPLSPGKCSCGCYAVGSEVDGHELKSVARQERLGGTSRQCDEMESELNRRKPGRPGQVQPAYSCSGYTKADVIGPKTFLRQGEWNCTWTAPSYGSGSLGGGGSSTPILTISGGG